MNASKDLEALTACTDPSPSLYLRSDRSVLKKNSSVQPSVKVSPFQAYQPLAKSVAASSHPFILFMHKEGMLRDSMQPEPHPVPYNI